MAAAGKRLIFNDEDAEDEDAGGMEERPLKTRPDLEMKYDRIKVHLLLKSLMLILYYHNHLHALRVTARCAHPTTGKGD